MAEPSNVTRARQRLATARERLLQLRREADAELKTAASFKDDPNHPAFTPEGLQKHRDGLRAKVRAKYEPKVAELQSQIKADAKAAEEWFESNQPKLGDDPGKLMRAQSKWDQARGMLDAGASIREVIASADAETLVAIREWAPNYLTTQARKEHPAGLMAGEFKAPRELIENTLKLTDERLASVHEGDFGQAYKTATTARAESAHATPLLQHLTASLNGTPTDGLRASLDAHYGAQAALAPADVGEAEAS